jgi:hypothetical protein
MSHGFAVLREPDIAEETSMDEGVEGLDAAVEHLGEAGYIAHVLDLELGGAEGGGGAAGADELETELDELGCELHETGFIGDA